MERLLEALPDADRLLPLACDLLVLLPAARVDDADAFRAPALLRPPVALRLFEREPLLAVRPELAERALLPREDPREVLDFPLLDLLRVLLLPLRDEPLRAVVPRPDFPPLVAIDDSPRNRWSCTPMLAKIGHIRKSLSRLERDRQRRSGPPSAA